MKKRKILSFIKKYPMSILLAIIATNLFSIAGSLRENAKFFYYKEVCARYYAFYSYGTDEISENNELITANKVRMPVELVDAYCQGIID